MNYLLAMLCGIMLLLMGCANDTVQDNQVLRFGCFLNSPEHQQELEQLLKEFSQSEGISVELIGLNWSDGKTKLISAFNS
ncbi:MAG: hypothetical protein ACK5ET_05855, partial [Ignavibacteria bacterium]